MIQFVVYGKPQTQGSTRVVPVKQKGGGYATDAAGRPRLIPIHQKGPELRAWRQDVAVAARSVYHGALIDSPLQVVMRFERPRPKSHYGTGRNSGRLKDSAPDFPTARPDLLKLARAVEDALTGVVWRDDSQIVDEHLIEEWGDVYRLFVEVQEL